MFIEVSFLKKLCNRMHDIVISEAFSTSSEIGFLKIRNTEDMIPKTFSMTTRALDNRWLKIRFRVPILGTRERLHDDCIKNKCTVRHKYIR